MKLPSRVAREIKSGFSMDQAGYIYPDGILVKIKVTLKHRGKPTDARKDVWYACAGAIHFGVNQKFDGTLPTRYVVHQPKSLLDGVTDMDMYWDNFTENMTELGLLRDTLSLTTESGAVHRFDLLGNPRNPALSTMHGTYHSTYVPQVDTPNFQETIEQLRSEPDVLEIVEFPSRS